MCPDGPQASTARPSINCDIKLKMNMGHWRDDTDTGNLKYAARISSHLNIQIVLHGECSKLPLERQSANIVQGNNGCLTYYTKPIHALCRKYRVVSVKPAGL